MLDKFKLFWALLFAGTALITLFFVQNTASFLWHYYKRSSTVPALVSEWQVRELKNGKYAIAAHYSFTAEKESCQGETVFSEPLFPNQYAAVDALKKEFASAKQNVWYNPKNHHDCTLEKKFPIMLTIRTTLALCVLLYFFYLRRFINHKYTYQE